MKKTYWGLTVWPNVSGECVGFATDYTHISGMSVPLIFKTHAKAVEARNILRTRFPDHLPIKIECIKINCRRIMITHEAEPSLVKPMLDGMRKIEEQLNSILKLWKEMESAL